MRRFKYELTDASGGVSAGVISAGTREEAMAIVRTQGDDVSITPLSGFSPWEMLRRIRFDAPPSRKEVLTFTNQLAVLTRAGVNLRDALRGITDRMRVCRFRAVLQDVQDNVEAGQSLSSALAAYPKVFPSLYIHMVRAAELSGTLGQTLDRIAGYLTQDMETRRMIRGAMIYPAIIFFLAIGATVFLLAFALPRFSTVFAGKMAALPRPTVILLAVSQILRGYWHVLIAGGLGLVAGVRLLRRTRLGRSYGDSTLLGLPVIGPMLHARYITQGLDAFSELISAGTPVLDSLSLLSDISGNVRYKDMWKEVQASVREGNKIAPALATHALVPFSVVQMVAAGEESGTLGEVLGHIADYYARELRTRIKTVCIILEPVMILVMGVLVGFIALSIILPIFKMSSLVR